MKPNIELPEDKQRIVEVLLAGIRTDFPQDIAIMACYGSWVTGTSTPVSDVDFYFIPKTNRGYGMSFQFIIDEIGYDLWPLSWERAKAIADFREPLVSIIADATVVYYGDSKDLKRYKGLQDRIRQLMTPEHRPFLLRRAQEVLTQAKAEWFLIAGPRSDRQDVKVASADILSHVLTALAYANSTHVRKGPANVENELQRLSQVPERFMDLYSRAILSDQPEEIAGCLHSLIDMVDAVIVTKRAPQDTCISNDTMQGFYEEMKSTYNKVYQSCRNEDYITAFFAATNIVGELKSLLGRPVYSDCEFPQLSFQDGDYQSLQAWAKTHEDALLGLLREHAVEVREFPSVEHFSLEFGRGTR